MSNKLNFDINKNKSEIKPDNEYQGKAFTAKNKETYIHLEQIDGKKTFKIESQHEPEIQNLLNNNSNRSSNNTNNNNNRPLPEMINLNHLFNSYSTKKAFATGLLDLALIATNFSQMKQLIINRRTSPWHVVDIVLLFSICASLILQIVCGVILIFSAKNEDFYDEEKRLQSVKNNNSITLIVLAITIVNIFINVFLNI